MHTGDDLLIVAPDGRPRFGHIERLVEAKDTGGGWGAVVVESTKGSSGRTHIHRGESEGFYLLSGDVEMCGFESVTRVRSGSFVLVPPDTEHTIRVLSGTASWLAIWPSKLDGLLEELEDATSDEEEAEIRRRHGVEPGRYIE